MVEDKNYKIGCRIECDGHRGILKYIGSVGDTKGQWLGIDWDEPSRGKHNGTHNNKEYFKTRHPSSGSFIRPEKAKLGISCPEAIRIRYGLVDDELAGVNRESLTSLQRKINVPVAVVGFAKVNKKQSKFENLRTILLTEENISHEGLPGELCTLCPNLEELDLSKNLISSWITISKICHQFLKLSTLNVSENYLPLDEDLNSLSYAFTTVQYLIMAKMNYDWFDIEKCMLMFHGIKKLSVSYNNIKTINEISLDSNLMKLQELTIAENCITSWQEVMKLGCLPRLEYLNVSSNYIEKICIDVEAPTDKTNLFVNLKTLNISKNNLFEWQSIRELEKFCQLESLKITDNPILKTVNEETVFQIIVSSISNLKLFNGHEIQDQERRGAEYDYLRLLGKKWVESENDVDKRNEFIKAHPRYPFLVKKYGDPDVPVPQPKAEMASNVITVEFVCPDDTTQTNRVKRKLLKDMNVQKVVGLAQRLFKTGGKIPELSFVQKKLSDAEIPLDKPLQELCYYSIEEGDQILVRW